MRRSCQMQCPRRTPSRSPPPPSERRRQPAKAPPVRAIVSWLWFQAANGSNSRNLTKHRLVVKGRTAPLPICQLDLNFIVRTEVLNIGLPIVTDREDGTACPKLGSCAHRQHHTCLIH